MKRVLLVLVTAALVTGSAVSAQGGAFPSRIDLPDGWQPEGIANAAEQFYVGSIPTGAVYRGSLRTGEGSVLVAPQTGRAAIGLKVDRGRLFVAGGPTGDGYVYDADTGETIATYDFATDPNTFVNDVVVTKEAAWFTDSRKAVLYRVPLGPSGAPGPDFTAVPLTGDFVLEPGFNVNGIDATPDGKTLVVVQSVTGTLFRVTTSGLTDAIELADGESVPNGDGILLAGKTLYVVQNQLNTIAEISLAPDLASGTVVRRIESPGFSVPTTIADFGRRLYAVNARFGIPTTEYWITQVRK